MAWLVFPVFDFRSGQNVSLYLSPGSPPRFAPHARLKTTICMTIHRHVSCAESPGPDCCGCWFPSCQVSLGRRREWSFVWELCCAGSLLPVPRAYIRSTHVEPRINWTNQVFSFFMNRGPEIEFCFGNEGTSPATENDWSLLPFMALSDGAHAYESITITTTTNWTIPINKHHSRSTEEFSYFTLRREKTSTEPATSLFGISCSRQIDANTLLYRPSDVTRSTVQKSVVVVTDSPQSVGQLREKLSVVTSAWFAQRYCWFNGLRCEVCTRADMGVRNFSDVDILKVCLSTGPFLFYLQGSCVLSVCLEIPRGPRRQSE